MKLRPLLVAEVRVWHPDLVPATTPHQDLGSGRLEDVRVVTESRVAPRLTQVHAHLVVLRQAVNESRFMRVSERSREINIRIATHLLSLRGKSSSTSGMVSKKTQR